MLFLMIHYILNIENEFQVSLTLSEILSRIIKTFPVPLCFLALSVFLLILSKLTKVYHKLKYPERDENYFEINEVTVKCFGVLMFMIALGILGFQLEAINKGEYDPDKEQVAIESSESEKDISYEGLIKESDRDVIEDPHYSRKSDKE